MLDQLSVFGLTVPPYVLIGLAVAAWIIATLAQRRRDTAFRGKMGQTLGSRLLRPLPSDLRVLATLGEGGRVQDTLGTITLRTTLGLRLIVILVSAALIYFLAKPPGNDTGLSMPGDPFLVPPLVAYGIYAAIALSVLGIFTYEVRTDHDILHTSKYLLLRHQYAWKDLISVQDTGQYEYVLTFRGGKKAKLMKYLVGMPRFLTFISEVIERNESLHARAARS
ncbi:MAG: hypothetical protein WCC57_02025 [Paracoccaceae bacterium]